MKKTIDENKVRERVSGWVLDFHFGKPVNELEPKELRDYEEFMSAYQMTDLADLNMNMIQLLSYMFWRHSMNSDHLQFAMGRGRRSVINTANALTRRGFLYWDIPIASNIDDGYDLTLDRSKKIKKD